MEKEGGWSHRVKTDLPLNVIDIANMVFQALLFGEHKNNWCHQEELEVYVLHEFNGKVIPGI